jgi:hypothetical protein
MLLTILMFYKIDLQYRLRTYWWWYDLAIPDSRPLSGLGHDERFGIRNLNGTGTGPKEVYTKALVSFKLASAI